MKSFKGFLKEHLVILEYLTDTQRAEYSKVQMTPKARSNTDHFFGEGNDYVREKLKEPNKEKKSETHKKIEQHLGSPIDADSYKKGLTKDKYNRDVKIGRSIKDENLRKEFERDTSRAGAKSSHGHYVTVVRGTEVAGQTNSAPNEQHPCGHAWGSESCKNIVSGSNKKFLKSEIKHGSVVVRVHDNTDKEIYRATLQPYHNDKGHVAYSVNGEYGVKNSNFTDHAKDTAKRLSAEHTGGSISYGIHPDVYNDSKISNIIHPNVSKELLDKGINDKDKFVRASVVKHPNAAKELLDKGINDKDDMVRASVLSNTKATKEHLDKGLADTSPMVRRHAVENPNATVGHIDKGIKDNDQSVRAAAARHPNATAEHLNKAMNDENEHVRASVLSNPKVTKEILSKTKNDESEVVRNAWINRYATEHPRASKEKLDKDLNDENSTVRAAAARHPNATVEHLDKGLTDKDQYVRASVVQNSKATQAHLDKGMNDKSEMVRWWANHTDTIRFLHNGNLNSSEKTWPHSPH
jgi:hypothetical protein